MKSRHIPWNGSPGAADSADLYGKTESRHCDIIGTSEYPIETLLQNYYGCMYLENMGWKKKGFYMEERQMRRAESDTEGSAERL